MNCLIMYMSGNMIKQKSNKEREREASRGKKRYMERLVETEEAERQIKEFDRGELIEDSGNERPISGPDGQRR